MPKPDTALLGYIVSGYAAVEPPPPGTAEHEEWLIDVGAEQTFPASDPPSSIDPGSVRSKTRDVRGEAAAGDAGRPTREK